MFNVTEPELNVIMPPTPPATPSYQQGSVRMSLQNADLWRSFHSVGTEMIITKQGRRMFPHCRFTLTGLQPLASYVVRVEMVPADSNKYKWRNQRWEIAGMAEPQLPYRTYQHPNSPAPGHQWMKQPLSFLKIKLTNNIFDQHGHFIMHSMQRYYPVFHVIPADDPHAFPWGSFTFAFPEMVFMAVTAYQNPLITRLKIAHNPFAKGFREGGTNSQVKRSKSIKRSRAEQSTPDRCCGTSSPGNTPGLQVVPLPSQPLAAGRVLTQQDLTDAQPSAWCVEQHSSERVHPVTPEVQDYEYSCAEQSAPLPTPPQPYRFSEYHRYSYPSSNTETAQAFHPPSVDHGASQYGLHYNNSADWGQLPLFSC